MLSGLETSENKVTLETNMKHIVGEGGCAFAAARLSAEHWF